MQIKITWQQLLDRGLNPKTPNLQPKIERLLKEIIDEKVRTEDPRVKRPDWRFKTIRYTDTNETYNIEIEKEKGVPKG